MKPQPSSRHVAVVGGGWAALSAAVHATEAGHAVVLFEMAGQLGGRARSVEVGPHQLDNGQHILIGAYRDTLALMQRVGASPQLLLQRLPLTLQYPDGFALRLPPGPPLLAFARGVLACSAWRVRDRLALLRGAAGWALRGFACAPTLTVAQLCAGWPQALRQRLIDPLCVAALNTPAEAASARIFLRVLKDALFSGPGSADLLLARHSLGQLLPAPAALWLQQRGAKLRLGTRVQQLDPQADGWRVNGEDFDAVVLACGAAESARLTAQCAAPWSAQAAALAYEPIITVYLRCPQARWPVPMLALRGDASCPAQFGFDLGALGVAPELFAFVISGAREWVERGLEATAQQVLHQAQHEFEAGTWPQPPTVLRVLAERRATFRCTPQLQRPPAAIAPRLVAAGDHVQGPYPATLEGAVRSGRLAVQALGLVAAPR